MYFDVAPKSKKEDFFNYEYQYLDLKKAIERKEKIIAIKGVRRVGKTSLMSVVFNEIPKHKRIWIDGRILKDPQDDIIKMISLFLSQKNNGIFGKIDSVNFSALGLGFKLNLKEGILEFENLLKKSEHLHIFIDEAQRTDGKKLSNFISYCYDRFSNISFIISGSEVGLINEILGLDDSEHSLFGRNIYSIDMKRLDNNKGFEFLSHGFRELKIKISDDELFPVLNELGGLIGWLAMFGYNFAVVKKKNALRETINMAVKISASEILHFLSKKRNPKLYKEIIKYADNKNWSELKFICEKSLRKKLNDNSFNTAVNELEKHSFIEKRNSAYFSCDPLFTKAIFTL
ncbi:MAG: ATP-binding protein [Candidatus Paceibacterota bacterium]|jgi:hypothetical protein